MRSTKHGETKKIKFTNILLFILIIVAIILIIIIGTRYSDRKKNEDAVKEVVSQINSDIQNNDDDSQVPYIDYEVIINKILSAYTSVLDALKVGKIKVGKSTTGRRTTRFSNIVTF